MSAPRVRSAAPMAVRCGEPAVVAGMLQRTGRRRVRIAALVVCGMLLAGVGACSNGGGASGPTTTLPEVLVPAGIGAAVVTETKTGTHRNLTAAQVANALPLLVRRVFDAPEAMANYGLDHPSYILEFAAGPTGKTVTLRVGSPVFDNTARYVLRDGDGRVWLVLTSSLAPFLRTP